MREASTPSSQPACSGGEGCYGSGRTRSDSLFQAARFGKPLPLHLKNASAAHCMCGMRAWQQLVTVIASQSRRRAMGSTTRPPNGTQPPRPVHVQPHTFLGIIIRQPHAGMKRVVPVARQRPRQATAVVGGGAAPARHQFALLAGRVGVAAAHLTRVQLAARHERGDGAGWGDRRKGAATAARCCAVSMAAAAQCHRAAS